MTTASFYVSEFEVRGADAIAVRIKFNDGRVFKVIFANQDAVKKALKASKSNCVAVPGLIMLEPPTMDKARTVLNEIVSSGYFEHLVPESDGE